MVFLLIKGNDLHTGISPSVDPSKREKFFEDLNALGMHVGPENRIVYVSYPNRPACTREAQLSLTRPLTFGNHGAPVSYKLKHLNFADHGRHILGNARSYHNRMAREGVYMYWNFCQYAGLSSEDPFDMIKKVTYVDEEGETHHCEPPQYHPIRHAEEVAQLRGRYQWHKQTAAMHRIVVSKKDLLFRQKQLVHKSSTAPQNILYSQIRWRCPVKFNVTQPTADSPSALPVLDQGNHIDTLLPTYSTAEDILPAAPLPASPHTASSLPITETDGHHSPTTSPTPAISDQVDHLAGSDMMPQRQSARKLQKARADYHTSTTNSDTWKTPAIDRGYPATSNHGPAHQNRTTDQRPTGLGKRKRIDIETTNGGNSGFITSSSRIDVVGTNHVTAKRICVDPPNKQPITDHNGKEVPNQSTTRSNGDGPAPILHVGDVANTSAPIDSIPDQNLFNNRAMLVDTPLETAELQPADVSMEHEPLSTDIEMVDVIADRLGNNGGTHSNQVGSSGSGDEDEDEFDNEDIYFDEGGDNDGDYRDGLAEDEYEVEAILDSRVNVSMFASSLFVCLRTPTF